MNINIPSFLSSTTLKLFRSLPGLVLLMSALFVFTAPLSVGLPPGAMPFSVGEKLTYQLRWGIIPAGTATLEVLPEKKIKGVRCFHFLLTAQSNGFVDAFYKVRDRIESFTDTRLSCSLLYKKHQHEGHTKRNVVVEFDIPNHKAQYSSDDHKEEPITLQPGTIDPLASLYFIRSNNLSKGLQITRPITDGKMNVMGLARVIKRESVTIRGTRYKTFVVEPDLKDVRGVFEKSKKSRIRLWITADDRRLLVKIKSKVIVGSFVGVLVETRNIGREKSRAGAGP